MRKWYYILLLLVACSPEKIDTVENVAIFGLWKNDERPTIQALIVDGDAGIIVPNQIFELVYPDGESSTFTLNESVYVSVSERVPQAGEILRLFWYRENDTAFVEVEMPIALDDVFVSNDTLLTNGKEECRIEWSTPAIGLEYALRLECLESDPEPLPWSPGNFSQVYSGPQLGTELSLFPQSFAYFGSHVLTISVLNDELLDAFFFDLIDIRGLLKQGPDNVSGGKGFVTGVTTKRILLEIE
jgi:hypothetical protein